MPVSPASESGREHPIGRFSLACAVVAVAVWTTVAILVMRRRAPEEDDPWR